MIDFLVFAAGVSAVLAAAAVPLFFWLAYLDRQTARERAAAQIAQARAQAVKARGEEYAASIYGPEVK